MKSIYLTLMTLAVSSFVASAQLDAADPLAGLAKLKDFETKRASSSDPDWRNGNGDNRFIKPGGTLTLGELDGPGQIVHIWFTIAHSDPFYSRFLTLKMFW